MLSYIKDLKNLVKPVSAVDLAKEQRDEYERELIKATDAASYYNRMIEHYKEGLQRSESLIKMFDRPTEA